VIPLSGRVSGRASGPSRSRVNDGGGLQYVFWKRVWDLRVFPSRRLNRRKGDVRGWTRRSHPLVARPRGARATSRCSLPLVRLQLSSGLSLYVR
jgi:hypothetical protein